MTIRNTFMLLPLLLGGVVTAGTLLVPASTRADAAPTKKDAQALYNRLAAAIKKRDTKGVGALATPDVVNKTDDGKTLTREQWLQSLDTNLKPLKSIGSVTFTVQKVTMQGRDMVVENTFHLMGTLTGPDGKAHKLDATSKGQDTWTKSGGKWLIKVQKDVPGGKTRIDGREFPTGAPQQ